MADRGKRIFDGVIQHPAGCPRGRQDCEPLSRISSPGFESYYCCGETSGGPVPQDTYRLCIAAAHDHGVDVMVNLDARDVIDTAAVLLAGLSSVAQSGVYSPVDAEEDSGITEATHE